MEYRLHVENGGPSPRKHLQMSARLHHHRRIPSRAVRQWSDQSGRGALPARCAGWAADVIELDRDLVAPPKRAAATQGVAVRNTDAKLICGLAASAGA
jgi:hypothetical protein